ncbi:MAG TPA: hypothetical protein VE862_09450 [Candidatus Acidoferrum sp.]|nr:hypothetical protein [Candidatus Acidoferrum sp.]
MTIRHYRNIRYNLQKPSKYHDLAIYVIPSMPTSVDPVDTQTVYSSLLIFPQLAKLVYDLKSWVSTNYP